MVKVLPLSEPTSAQSLSEEKDIATLNNYADKKFQETSQLSEVISTMPSLVKRGGIYLISTAVGLMPILLYLGKVPIWVEARGNIVPEVKKISVRATEKGLVTGITAKVGQQLPQDATLLEIEPIDAHNKDVPTVSNSSSITMPEAGIVRELKIKNPGKLISPGITAAIVTPRQNKLTVEATVGDRDLAAIKPDMEARIKIDAYDFRQFGTIPARVTEIIPNLDRPGEFTVVLDLLEDELTHQEDAITLQPGLNVRVEMQTGEKRLFEILFSKYK